MEQKVNQKAAERSAAFLLLRLNMRRIIPGYVELAESASNPNQLRDAVAKVVGAFDFNAFAFLVLSDGGKPPLLISNYDKDGKCKTFDIRSGVTLPIPDWPGGLAAKTFATDQRHARLTTYLQCNGAALLFVTAHVQSRWSAMDIWTDLNESFRCCESLGICGPGFELVSDGHLLRSFIA